MRVLNLLFTSSLLVNWAVAQTPTIATGGIVNAASFQAGQAITPGSLISIFGTGLASTLAQADSIPLSTSMGGVSVQFVNGSVTANAPLLYMQPDNPANNVSSQINLQVPWEIVTAGTSATVNVIVTNNGVSSQPTPVSVAPFSPGVFSSNGLAIAQNADGSLAWAAGTVPNLVTHAAKAGDVLVIYATGLGAVDSAVQDGQNSIDKLRNTLTKPIVLIGGMSAQVLFSGLSPQFVGVNQLNVVVPNAAPGSKVPLQLQLGGTTTSDQIGIAITQ